MPWTIEKRDDEYCVVKEGESEPVPGGCHNSRVDAVKHQRALYANEVRVASLYAELDRVEEVAQTELEAAHNIRVVLEQPESLTAAMLDTLRVISDRLDAGDRMNEALVAALKAQPTTIVVEPSPVAPPTVMVAAPEVHVEPQITVEPAQVGAPTIIVEPASPQIVVEPTPIHVDVAAPNVNVAAPNVKVEPQINLPAEKRKVEFERDAIGRLTGAVVEEG